MPGLSGNNVTDENKKIFFDHAKEQGNREACALLIIYKGRERLIICRNVAPYDYDFIINPDDYVKAETLGEIVGVVHSHVNSPPLPSESDSVACYKTGLKWYIVSMMSSEWFELYPKEYKAPLVGRTWAHGVLDCYSLVVDYYKEVLNIEIPDFKRQYEWWHKGENLFLDNFKKAGFYEVSIEYIQANDGLLMQIESPVINHGAVYLGGGMFLHHLHNRLSSRDLFNGFWKNNTIKVVRHKGVNVDIARDKVIW